jgi:hypothetical protein
LQLARLEKELKEDTYRPQPVLQHPIPKRDKPGEYRMLGVPTILREAPEQWSIHRLAENGEEAHGGQATCH